MLSPEFCYAVLAGLLSEALAMVDLLVLVQAERFAGWFLSSFSWAVQASHAT